MDFDFWVLESYKLVIKYGYQGVNEVDENGCEIWLKFNQKFLRLYLKNGQEVVVKCLVIVGYCLGEMLNLVFGEQFWIQVFLKIFVEMIEVIGCFEIGYDVMIFFSILCLFGSRFNLIGL